jgi:hypothetical protein
MSVFFGTTLPSHKEEHVKEGLGEQKGWALPEQLLVILKSVS